MVESVVPYNYFRRKMSPGARYEYLLWLNQDISQGELVQKSLDPDKIKRLLTNIITLHQDSEIVSLAEETFRELVKSEHTTLAAVS